MIDYRSDSKEKHSANATKTTTVRKKIQLPLKMGGRSANDSKKIVLQSKSQERGGTLSNNSNSGQGNPVFNSVTIRNIKASVKGASGEGEAHRSTVQRSSY